MEKNLIVVYRFRSEFDGDLSPKEGINIYDLHARAHDGKVLFTTKRVPDVEKNRIKSIILMTKDGSFAIKADVVDWAKGDINLLNKYKEEYKAPSIWDNEDRREMACFAISNIKRISIKRGDYTVRAGKDLIDSMSGAAPMVYVEIEDER